jgi:hypothetical protein
MARATITKAKPVGRPPSGRAIAVKTGAVKQRGAPKMLAMTAAASKEELRARVEKLERANATLRVKNKELRIIAVEAAEQVDALTVQLQNSERRAGRQARHEAPAEAVETREILRPARGKRKVRAVAGEHGHDGQDLSGEPHTAWGSHDQDHAEA